jgi:hypothetical protein
MSMGMLSEPMRPWREGGPARGRCPAVPMAMLMESTTAVFVGVGVVVFAHRARPPPSVESFPTWTALRVYSYR